MLATLSQIVLAALIVIISICGYQFYQRYKQNVISRKPAAKPQTATQQTTPDPVTNESLSVSDDSDDSDLIDADVEWDINDFMQFVKSIGIRRTSYNKIKRTMTDLSLSVSDLIDADVEDFVDLFGVNRMIARKIRKKLEMQLGNELNECIPKYKESNDKTFCVNISSRGRKIKLRTPFTAKSYVSDVVQAYKDEEGFNRGPNICLYSQGKQLQHNKTLGYYNIINKNNFIRVQHMIQGGGPDDIKIDEKEVDQSTQEITNLMSKLDINDSDYNARKKIYIEAKKIYKFQKSPVFIHKNIKEKIKSNKKQYNKANALPFTLTMDRDFKTFNRAQFKREFSTKLNIPIDAIKIISVTEGCTIVHTNLHAFEQNGVKYTVGAIAEKMSETDAAEKLAEFDVFLAEFGEPIDTFKPLQQQILMNPKWNRIYGTGHVEWNGTLNNDKTEPYYCPRGWRKYACKVTDTSEQFDVKYKSWPVAYHGTKFSLSMMISFSRLRAGGQPNVKKTSGKDCFGTGVYFSPSIEYVAHPLYASPKKMSNNAKEHAGKWVQVVLNCRLKPNCWQAYPASVGDRSQQIDANYKNNEIEWLVHAPNGTYLDESKVIFCGYMFRVTDNDPRQLPSSRWWNLDAYDDSVDQWYE